MMKVMLVAMLCVCLGGCAMLEVENAPTETPAPTQQVSDVELPSELSVVGLDNLKDVEEKGSGIMRTIRGKTNDSLSLDVTVTLENDVPIYIMISGIPVAKTKATVDAFGKVSTKMDYTAGSVDMFSDTEGGYLAVYDSEAGTITDYETGDIIVSWE